MSGTLTSSFPTGFMIEGKDQMEWTLLPSLPSARLRISALQRVMELRLSIPSIRFRVKLLNRTPLPFGSMLAPPFFREPLSAFFFTRGWVNI